MITKKTPRLFYKNFPFKAVIILKIDTQWGYMSEQFDTNFDMYPKNEVKIRREGRWLSVFFKDRLFFDTLKLRFGDSIIEFHEPENDTALKQLLTNQKIEVRKDLVKNCRHRVVLKGGVDSLNNANLRKIAKTIKDYPDEFSITNRVLEYLEGTQRWAWNTSYFYVKDTKFLTLIQLSSSSSFREVITFVTHDELKEKENEQ
jgi:hypothetical protein